MSSMNPPPPENRPGVSKYANVTPR
jgi:hypothetical protein